MKNKIFKLKNVIYALSGAALIIAIWIIAAAATDSEIILPGPVRTLREFLKLLKSAEFYKAVWGSTGRSLLSFGGAVFFAVLFCALAARFKTFEKIFAPVITFLRAIPTMSIILITLIWFSSSVSPMVIAFLITFPLLYNSFLTAYKNVDENLITMAEAYGCGVFRQATRLYIPIMLPDALSAMRASVSLSLKVTVAAEVMAQTVKSIGVNMQQSMIYFETAELLAWTAAAIIISYVMELIAGVFENYAGRWKNEG